MIRISTRAIYWKILVVILFVGISCFAISLQSERWVSLAKGILFFSDLTGQEQLALIRTVCFFSVPILSISFLLIRNRIATMVLIGLMIFHSFLIFPTEYVEDLTMNF